MIKQATALVALSIGTILTMSYGQEAVQMLIQAHDWISGNLTEVFSGGRTGNLLRGLIALLSIPIFVGLIPAISYWVIKRHWFPYFMEVVWVVWLIQTGALLVAYKIAS